MPPLARTALGVATAPTRLTVELALAAPTVVMALSSLARDTSVLVAELARLSRDAPRGALSDLVAGLARLAGEDGELTVLLREQARLAAARADEASSPSRPATPSSRQTRRGSTRSDRRPARSGSRPAGQS